MRHAPRSLHSLQDRLLRMSMRWSVGVDIDIDAARSLRRGAISQLHQRYLERIPVYSELASRAGMGPNASFEDLAANMLLSDGVFKSYPQRLLDARDFGAMNDWLGRLYHQRIDVNVDGVETPDEWIERLGEHGIHAVYSSGTSGTLSFVPRDEATWKAFRKVPLLYAPGFLARRGLGARWKNALASVAGRALSPSTFQNLFERLGLRDFDGIFLNFTGGNQGIQLVGQELAQKVRKATFLYPIPISATALRSLARGPGSDTERRVADAFIRETVQRKEQHYARVIDAMKRAQQSGQKVLMFGAPYLVKEVCERIVASEGRLDLHPGSTVFHGGGWKSFEGEKLDERALLDLVERATGLPAVRSLEAYSMTEICAVMPKCADGRFHVPPYLETVLLDEALEPVDGDEVAGILGVMDPFAESYPGFLITGDNVRRTRAACPCGIVGDSLLEVGRAAGAEVKGCGGIMAAMNA